MNPPLPNTCRTALGRLQYEAAKPRNQSSSIPYHLGRAIASYVSGQPFALFRTVDDFRKEACLDDHPADPYHDAVHATPTLNPFNSHNGQRKLAMGVLEFFVDSMRQLPPGTPIVIVYAGASAAASAAIAKLFPHVQIIMFDYAPDLASGGRLLTRGSDSVPTTIIQDARKDVRRDELRQAICVDKTRLIACANGEAGRFDDEVAKDVVDFVTQASPDAKILFISDIRRDDKTEQTIAEDMMAQKKWVEISRCFRFMLKFRMPYQWTPNILAAFDSTEDKKIKYLAGSLYLQLYPPATSAELRLVGSGTALETAEYNVRQIEDTVNLFNNVYRSHAVFGPNNALYESVAENAIMRSAAHLVGRDPSDVLQDVNRVVPPMTYNSAIATARKRWKELDDEGKAAIDLCDNNNRNSNNNNNNRFNNNSSNNSSRRR